ncbi:hypothetical protein Golob_012958, partial [Gossypium lobatum]|nr:hypothetical protein [Gossypium lobatum]
MITDNVLLAYEVLHTFKQKEGLLKGAKVCHREPVVSHLLFADDCILFGEASERGAGCFKRILKEYEEASSHCVNYEKSTTFYSMNTSIRDRELVTRILIRLTNTTSSPKCKESVESREHVFKDYAVTKGIVVRDPNGKVLGSRTVLNENAPLLFASKALACIKGLQLGSNLRVQDTE